MTPTHDGRTGGGAAVLPRAAKLDGRGRRITHAQLIRDWGRTLDAFGEALEDEERYFSASELNQLERHLASDRRWLGQFAAIRSFP